MFPFESNTSSKNEIAVSGCGVRRSGSCRIVKTTLLRVLAGLLVPFAGRVVRAPELGRGAIGYVPQRSPLQDDFPATVWKVVLMSARSHSKTKGDAALAMLSAWMLALGYLAVNLFPSSSNVSGDVCTTLFGSTSILTRPFASNN